MKYRIKVKFRTGVEKFLFVPGERGGRARHARFETREKAQAAVDRRNADNTGRTYRVDGPLRALRWCFDDVVVYDGFTDETRWNGFINVWVKPSVRDALVAALRKENPHDEYVLEDAAAFDAMTPIETKGPYRGLICLGYGYTTCEVK